MTEIATISGVGTTNFGKQPNIPARELVWQAVSEAILNAKINPKQIDAVFAGTVFGDPGVATRSLQQLGIDGVPIITIENACASSTSAFHEGCASISTGRYETVLALGIETMTASFSGAIPPILSDPEGAQGFAMPALYGMSATRYQHEFGVTNSQLAAVSVKNHGHGQNNSRAQHQKTPTITEVLESPMISSPLTLLQCCSIADAAAAAVLRPAGTPGGVRVRSSSLKSGGLWDQRSELVWGWQIVADTSRAAYEQAGVSAQDVDVFEVHDAFTIGEIITTEALGLTELGGGGRLVESGHTSIGGSQPVNPSGGLLSRGHPLGATGLAQIAEIAWQLRGEAGPRQVADARLGVVETMGGGTAGVDGNACVVTVLESPAVQGSSTSK
ncbi:MAG: thiolase family protein [Acidimicrobiales bacterium]|nr:thiolase family protein [Acidimicrobiales bacterium]